MLLEKIKRGLEFAPSRIFNKPADDIRYFNEVFFPVEQAIIDNDQEVIAYLEKATIEERWYAFTGVESGLQERQKKQLLTESVDDDLDRVIQLCNAINEESCLYTNENTDDDDFLSAPFTDQ